MKTGDQYAFREIQAFPIWAYVVMAICTIASVSAVLADPNEGQSMALALAVLLVLGLTTNLLAMKTTVDNDSITVTFGAFITLYRRSIPKSEITSAFPEMYNALGEFGGWGIRGWGKNVALNARGNRGVRLTLTDGRKVLLGSQRPDELTAALERTTTQS